MAGAVSVRELASAVSEAEVQRLLERAAVGGVLERNRGRRGASRLRSLLADLDPQTRRTRSTMERRFLAICRRNMLPIPEVNASIRVADTRVEPDFLWRDARLIVETDGRKYHDTPSAFERDRRRDQQLQMAGWRVIRCTWRQVVDEPVELSRTLRALLAC
jgi:very-short-patch-repair endonuclease